MNRTPIFSGPLLDRAREVVRQRTGLVFSDSRLGSFAASLDRGLRRSGTSDARAYLERLPDDAALLDELIVEITVGETYFFRDPKQFAFLRDDILPLLARGGTAGRELRLWSAGCATGEEPYTLAILLDEANLAGSAQVIGSDVSRAALTRAARASYTKWSLRGVSDDVAQRYFVQRAGRFELVPRIRDAVEFRYLNLAEDRYPSLVGGIGSMDVILCRNVLIYFDAPTIARVAGRLLDSLSTHGWLLLGAADPPLRDVVDCDVVVTASGVAYRRRGAGSGGIAGRAGSAAVAAPPPERERHRQTPRWSAPAQQPAAVKPARERMQRAACTVDDAQENAEAAVTHVRMLANRGELLAADAACTAALERHTLHAELVYLHAVLLTEAGRHADAATALRRALYLERSLIVAHLALGDVLVRLGDDAGAALAFTNAERLLEPLPFDAIVPGSDGETAGRLLTMVRVRKSLNEGSGGPTG